MIKSGLEVSLLFRLRGLFSGWYRSFCRRISIWRHYSRRRYCLFPNHYLGDRFELPVVDKASMASEWSNGDLKLSWQNQTMPPETHITIWIVKGEIANFSVYLSISVPQDFQEVIIPKRVIDSAKILRGVDFASWRIELRYIENDNNSARGASDWAEIPGWN